MIPGSYSNPIRINTYKEPLQKLGSEKGAHNWLTALPIAAHGVVPHKGAFRDALYLRYNWTPLDLPRECVCDTITFSTEHALSCPSGGLTICQHNEVRDLMANLLTDICHDINVEPACKAFLAKHSPPVA